LKDFRDVRGDALFGKRTFLVRHGRRATCALSAVFLVVGVAVLPFVRDLSPALAVSYLTFLVVTLALLRAVARSDSPRRDEALIAAIATIGRGLLVTLYAHFAMATAHWSLARSSAVTAGLTVAVVWSARNLARLGPQTRTTVPEAWAVEETLDTPARVL
jgi:1,4-dihydroxy-2-naphthoate octaprenyltransferase